MIAVAQRALAKITPPPRLRLSEWIERNIYLPEGVSATPGRVRLWPWQTQIADAMSDPDVERITLVKPVRVGFTALLTAMVGSHVKNDPAPILFLLPTESDCRDYAVSDLEPVFDATPALRGSLGDADDLHGRNTLLSRRFPGGALKIVAARAPRNLRRHTARILICDEADAMEATAEGSPLRLAERRTLTFSNRKIVLGSTPTFTDTSNVLRAYAESDQRVFECPCPRCGAFNEIQWAQIVWPEGKPEEAEYECPHCHGRVSEPEKPRMVAAGQWRATKPEVRGHAGFRLNALISLLANASWAKLAVEFLSARNDPQELQTFVNTFLGQGWSTPSIIDEGALAARAEDFGLDRIPIEVLVMTAGCDVQDDRVEMSILGWTRAGECLILGHVIVWGSFTDDSTWGEVDNLLRTKWRHPFGGLLKLDCCLIDASDGDHYDAVLRFTIPRIGRRIFASKGMFGARPIFAMSTNRRLADRLGLVGVDTIKNALFDRLARGRGIRFSKSLEPSFYEQLASERRVVRYTRGMPTRRFDRIGRQRAEALDATVYATAARQAVKDISLDRREAELKGRPIERRPITDFLASAGPSNTANVPGSSVGKRTWP